MKLLDHLTDIFRSRGYEVMVSSPENSYLLLKRDGSTLAVGYADPGHLTTEGEAQMFLSMAEDGSADSTLFISPEKLKRPVRKTLEQEGSAIWDRMALAIALGEQVLSDRDVKDKVEEAATGAQRIMNLFRTKQPDPLKELRKYEKEKEDDFSIIEDKTPPGISRSEPPSKKNQMEVMKLEFPESEKDVKSGVEVSTVSDDILLGAWAGFDDWKNENKPNEKIMEDTSEVAVSDTPPEMIPWIGSTLAPVKCSREGACTKASAPVDTELSIEHVPHILVNVDYSLRSEDGDLIEKNGNYLYDPLKNDLLDIPQAVSDELRSILSVWDGKDPSDKMKDAKDSKMRYERILRDRLGEESHAEDKLVRETLMSTIYQEVRYLFDPASFRINWSNRVVIPFWIKKDEGERISWMVDAYLGRFIQIKHE